MLVQQRRQFRVFEGEGGVYVKGFRDTGRRGEGVIQRNVGHGFSAFENGWVGSEDMFKTRSRRTEPLEQRSSLTTSSTNFTTHTRYTLNAHSLVCIKWSHRNRKRPFKRVHLSSKKDPGLRCACVRSGPLRQSSPVEHQAMSDYFIPLQYGTRGDPGLKCRSFPMSFPASSPFPGSERDGTFIPSRCLWRFVTSASSSKLALRSIRIYL